MSSRRIRAPCTRFVSSTRFTSLCSASSLQAILTRFGFFRSRVTARQRQLVRLVISRISFSTFVLIVPAEALSASSLATLDVSTVQYRVSVKVDGVVPIDEIERTFPGTLFGGVRATSAYEGLGLIPAEALRAALLEMTST